MKYPQALVIRVKEHVFVHDHSSSDSCSEEDSTTLSESTNSDEESLSNTESLTSSKFRKHLNKEEDKILKNKVNFF